MARHWVAVMAQASRFYQLDLIRFIAHNILALMHYAILLGHPVIPYTRFGVGTPSTPHDTGLNWLANSGLGTSALIVFMVVSGFGFPRSLTGKSMRDTLAQRMLPTWTIYLVCLLITCSALYLVCGIAYPTQTYLENIFLIPQVTRTLSIDMVSWFIGLQMLFYFSTMFFFAAFQGRYLGLFIVALLAIAMSPVTSFQSGRVNFEWLSAYASGMAIHLWASSAGERRRYWQGGLVATAIAVTFYLCRVRIMGDGNETFPVSTAKVVSALVAISIVYALILAIVSGWVRKLEYRVFRRIDSVGYAFFLLHTVIGMMISVKFLGLNNLIYKVPFLIAFFWGLAYLVTYHLEPLLRQGLLRLLSRSWFGCRVLGQWLIRHSPARKWAKPVDAG